MLTISKFGGSSLSSPIQFRKVKDIILKNQKRKVVVVSALGKRDNSDNKITDLLYLLHAHIKYSVPYENILNMIYERFKEIKDTLELRYDFQTDFSNFRKELNKEISEDYLVSRGEYFTAKMMADYLGFTFIDAKDVIYFNYNGTINYDECSTKISSNYDKYGPLVIPGFYGSYPNGQIKLLSRGGSDITGAICARGLKASIYENWTDVSGILMADPKIINNPLKIKQITYDELRELSYMGANVLHEETIIPIQEINIPINILNTNNPDEEGTIITKDCTDTSQIITGISGKKHFISITITKSYSSKKSLLISNVLDIFNRFNVRVEHIPTSIDSFSVVVPSNDVEKNLYDITNEINKINDVENIKIDNDIALVAIVGRNMVTRPGISGRLFGILGNNNINIKMIAQGAHELNIILGISNNDFEKTINAIYNNVVIK